MAINNVSWSTADKVTSAKLAAMVQDEVNTTDDIHNQYNEARYDNRGGNFSVNYLGDAGKMAIRISMADSNNDSSFGASVEKIETIGTGTNRTFCCLSIPIQKKAAFNNLKIEIAAYKPFAIDATLQFRYKIFEITAAGASTLFSTGTAYTPATDATYQRLELDGGTAIDITGITAGNMIVVCMEAVGKYSGTQSGFAYFKNLKAILS